MTYLESQSRRRYKLSRKFLWGTLIGFIVAILIGVHCIKESDAVALRRSYSAVCLVRAGVNTGTGVLLDTGYVLSAAHVFDRNRDSRISNGERNAKVHFGDGSMDEHRARVIYFDMKLDFAFLEVKSSVHLHKKDGIRIALLDPRLATKIYTIGCTNSQPPILSEGRVAYGVGHFGRASCFVYSGNSGGPILNEDHEIFGVVVGMGYSPKTDNFLVPLEDGRFEMASISRIEPISGIAYYIKAEDIYVHLLSKNIDSLLIERPNLLIEDPRYHYAIAILESAIGIQIFLLFVYAIRKHLFSSSVR